MKIISWNVNGIRARIKQGFDDAIKEMKPDILCLQEFRARPGQIPKDFLIGYNHYHSISDKPGYAGSSVFIKKELSKPIVTYDDYINGTERGRVCILEFTDYILISCYTPNSGQNLEKLAYRVEWENGLLKYLKSLAKPVIFCGDTNVSPKKIDAGIRCLAGTSPEERAAFQDKLDIGMIDVFRYFYPNTIDYTWFSNQRKVKNKGMRIDDFLVTKEIIPHVKDIIHVHDEHLICGSDHIPVILEMEV